MGLCGSLHAPKVGVSTDNPFAFLFNRLVHRNGSYFEQAKHYSTKKVALEFQKAHAAAKQYARKNERISIRIYGDDLENIRKIALREGLPYQTLITSVLHKFSTGLLVGR